ncbi:hypothetical protein ACFQ3Z_34980 [Streptomyces nogalater]
MPAYVRALAAVPANGGWGCTPTTTGTSSPRTAPPRTISRRRSPPRRTTG